MHYNFCETNNSQIEWRMGALTVIALNGLGKFRPRNM